MPIDWPNFIVWLPLLCEILDNMCIAIVCKPDWILRLTLSFQSSLFSYMAKKSLQKRIYLDNEKRIKDGIKSIFHHFKGLSVKQITRFFERWESDFKVVPSWTNSNTVKSIPPYFHWLYRMRSPLLILLSSRPGFPQKNKIKIPGLSKTFQDNFPNFPGYLPIKFQDFPRICNKK